MKQKLFTLFFALVASVSATLATTTEITVAKALEIGAALSEGAITDETYDIVGYVTQIDNNSFNTIYKNMVFWIADENNGAATNAAGAFEVYRGKPTQELKVGDKVSVKTKIQNNKGTIESVSSAPVTLLEESVVVGTCGDNLRWTLSNGTLTISGTGAMEDYSYPSNAPWYDYRSYIRSVIISDNVISIGDAAFYDCSSLTSITIGNSVTSIGDETFGGCSSLTSITIGNSVTSIGDAAFYDCSSLTSITIGNSVTSIGDETFGGCSSLTSITIGNSVTSIGDEAFGGCSSLTSINVDTNNANYCSIDGVLFSKDKTTLIQYPFGNTRSEYIIPNNVISIGERAFYNCQYLTSITIGNNVTSIGDAAFWGCKSLTSITIPNSVTSIGNSAFWGCKSLTSITIPNSVTSIGNSAFCDCSSLTSITIPNSVTSIGYAAFYYCSSLASVTIPNSVTSIGVGAFAVCSSLTSINVADDNPNYCSMDGVLFSKDRTTLIQYPSRKQGAYTIPNSVTSIGYAAFYYCQYLTSITIGNNVTSIGDAAFYDCQHLTSVTIPNSVTSIGGTAFYGCYSLTSVTIPNSVTSIGELAFYHCFSIASPVYNAHCFAYMPTSYSGAYTIPEGIKQIAGGAFYDCSSLTSVTVEAETPPTIGGSVFYTRNDDGNDKPLDITIYVPCGTIETYRSAWSEYASQIKYEPLKYHITGNVNIEGSGSVQLPQNKCEDVITASPNYGYHFVRWNDGNTDNPRTIVLASDTTFTAEFAHNPIITYVYNSQMGSVSGPTITTTGLAVEYITFNATPNFGCHFVQWSDGLKDNPRIAQITQDTTFTAEFAYDRVGTCGKDLALVWSYDPTNKVLTIGNAGEFTENMRFGVEAPGEMEELVIGNSVTAIGENAFAGISTLKKVTIGESVKTIHNNAFYNCVNLETIFNYRPTPTNAYSTAFDGVDKFACSLYVLPSSIDMYKNASVWRDFYYTYAIGAEETTVTTNNVTVEPQDNAATLTWPTSENAATYTIEITKDGVVFCTLIFNGNGQLTGIAFAPGKNGNRHAPAAKMTANGLQFTVTGLNSATHYALTLQAKDDQNVVLASYSSEFTTTGTATGVDNVPGDQVQSTKVLRNGTILILRNGKTYTMQGQEVK